MRCHSNGLDLDTLLYCHQSSAPCFPLYLSLSVLDDETPCWQPSKPLLMGAVMHICSAALRYAPLHNSRQNNKCWSQVNYNLMAVNAFMAMTGLYQLSRKIRQDYGTQLGLGPGEEKSTSP